MRQEYFQRLQESLSIIFQTSEVENILTDYEELYDGYLEKGLTEDEIEQKLGSPYDIAKALNEDGKLSSYFKKNTSVVMPPKKRSWITKLPGVMTFVVIIIFLVGGLSWGIWHPLWLVFLLIPVSGIIVAPYRKGKIVALMPFIATTIFVLVGHLFSLYQYSWIAFLLIPLVGALYSNK